MTYISIPFIFFSLFVLIIFSFLKPNYKNWWLFIASIMWYFSWGNTSAFILVSILVFNFITLTSIKRFSNFKDNVFLGLTVINIALLVYLKLMDNTPYGTSFFMLMILGMIIDFWRRPTLLKESDSVSLLTMPVFFPLLMAGPIERTQHFFPELKKSHFSMENLSDAVILFGIGMLKRLFISNPIEDTTMFKTSSGNILIDGLVHTFVTYILFSSYCDMGRGVARAFGINLTVNFKAFYYSKNPQEFWQRWNITLGTWIRDYLTMPLMFRFGRKISPNLIVIFSFIFIGLWHGLSFNWLVFGLFNGLMIYLYLLLSRKFKPVIIGYLTVWCVWIGNGIFQNKLFLTRLQSPFSWTPSFDLSRINLLVTGLALMILFIYEFIQEKKQDTDFILKSSKYFKYALSTVLILAFFYALSNNSFTNVEENLPVYFRI